MYRHYISSQCTPFSCPPCLDYLRPRALILSLWRYTSHLLAYLLTFLEFLDWWSKTADGPFSEQWLGDFRQSMTTVIIVPPPVLETMRETLVACFVQKTTLKGKQCQSINQSNL